MKLLATLLASALAALPAQAFLANVAFTDNGAFAYTGPLVIGDPGDPWTAFSVGNGTQTIATGVDLTVSGADFAIYYDTAPALPPTDVTGEYIYASGSLAFDLTGLDPAMTYDIYLVANLDGYFDGSARNVTASGLNAVGPVAITNDSSVLVLTQGANWILLDDVQPTALGAINIAVASDVGVTALQISAIPEPSAFAALAGLGALALVVRRRSHR